MSGPRRPDDEEGLATLVTFSTLAEAQVAKGMLEAAGVESWIADSETASAAWQMTPAMGGIRLQVARDEIERARAVFDAEDEPSAASRLGNDDDDRDDEESDGDTGEGSAAGEDVDPDSLEVPLRDRMAIRAWKASIVGLVLLPGVFHLYSLALLVMVANLPGPLAPASRRRATWAAAVDAVALVAVAFVTVRFLRR